MSEKSGVMWTEASWGPWRGCAKVGPGCLNCYAERDMKRYGHDHSKVVRAADRTFTMPLRLKEPTEIFVCPWSDFWIPEADAWREAAFDIIRRTPHRYLIPTKRPKEMAERLPADWGQLQERIWPGLSVAVDDDLNALGPWTFQTPGRWWLSFEPAVGTLHRLPEYLGVWWNQTTNKWVRSGDPFFCGVVMGGESGPGFRSLNLDSVRSVRDQCAAAGIPFCFKQDAGVRPSPAGRILDGQTHDALSWRPL